jgi:A/G-specific adenine glycosylase
MERFPTLAALAEADEESVLRLWEGLGYYSRARNLQRAARQVMDQHNGQLPADQALLEKIPGIGRYTAGAIASIAFGLDAPALDGNIRRVLARIFNMALPARSPQGEARLWELAARELPSGQAGDFNQAMMDLGATLCTPTNPTCLVCPVAAVCQAFKLGKQADLPVLAARAPVPHITVTAAVIAQAGRVLLARRPSKGLLGGMWEFPGGKLEAGETLPEGLIREIREELAAEIEVGQPFGVYEHAYTHFQVTLHAFLCCLQNGSQPQALEASELRWATPAELQDFPMGKIDRRISQRVMKEFLPIA